MNNSSSENHEQVDDLNHHHPIHNLDETESHLTPQNSQANAVNHEEDDFSEDINDDDDADDDESMLEEVDDDANHREPNHDYYRPSPLFEGDYRCYPLSFINKGDLEVGNRIILPAEALAPIIHKQIPMPLQFEIHNLSKGKVSNCGVYEFSGLENGAVFMPDWMMENMQLKEGDYLYMKNTNLEKGTHIKIQPHTTDFIEILNPKSVLEENLQKFSCLTKGDTIMIGYESKKFRIDVVETKPADGISVIDTDIEVDFAAPLDYKEPEREAINLPNKKLKGEEKEATEKPEFKPFTGLARKLGAEPSSDLGCLRNKQQLATPVLRGIEAVEVKAMSNSKSQPRNKGKELSRENVESENKPKFQPFTGKKYTLGG